MIPAGRLRAIARSLVFCFLFCCTSVVLPRLAHAESVEITAKRIVGFDLNNLENDRFGAFRFVGGLVLQSDNQHFGSFSALRMTSDDVVTSVTDSGRWFQATLKRDPSGDPIGFEQARIAPIRDATGRSYLQKWNADAEALTFTKDAAYVSVEQIARVMRFELGGDLLETPSQNLTQALPGPPLERNFGLEALVTLPPLARGEAERILAISEYSLNSSGNIRAFVLDGDVWQELSVKPRDGYFITDANILPSGEILLLERKFSPARGAAIRIRKIDAQDVTPGAVLDGPHLLDLNRSHQIDNMEGLAVFAGPDGSTRIGMISDDNHFLLQRTLYLEFELMPQQAQFLPSSHRAPAWRRRRQFSR